MGLKLEVEVIYMERSLWLLEGVLLYWYLFRLLGMVCVL